MATTQYTDEAPCRRYSEYQWDVVWYTSTISNANRLRANAISTILLCNDYLQHPISFERDSNLLDEEGVAEAIKTDLTVNVIKPLIRWLLIYLASGPQSTELDGECLITQTENDYTIHT